jgi:hypothetical protein
MLRQLIFCFAKLLLCLPTFLFRFFDLLAISCRVPFPLIIQSGQLLLDFGELDCRLAGILLLDLAYISDRGLKFELVGLSLSPKLSNRSLTLSSSIDHGGLRFLDPLRAIFLLEAKPYHFLTE